MTRIPRAALIGLVLLGLAVALAVLGLGPGGAKPAAAQPLTPNYKCYTIDGAAPGVAPVDLSTEFGLHPGIVVGTPELLCLPAGINGEPIPEVPHLKCYNIVGPDPDAARNLMTRFGREIDVLVNQAKLLCVPATKTIVPEPPGPAPDPMLPHYECFDIVAEPTMIPEVMLETQFGVEGVVYPGLATKLCAPALKNGEGDLSAPALKCYYIAGAPPGPVVNLTTQFGVEADVLVNFPTMLCTATLSGVGGIAELPDMAGSAGDQAAATDSGSGWSSAGYAALAAGLAGAAVLLSAGVWYARRRLLR